MSVFIKETVTGKKTSAPGIVLQCIWLVSIVTNSFRSMSIFAIFISYSRPPCRVIFTSRLSSRARQPVRFIKCRDCVLSKSTHIASRAGTIKQVVNNSSVGVRQI